MGRVGNRYVWQGGQTESQGGQTKNFFRRFAPNFIKQMLAHPGLTPCRRPCGGLHNSFLCSSPQNVIVQELLKSIHSCKSCLEKSALVFLWLRVYTCIQRVFNANVRRWIVSICTKGHHKSKDYKQQHLACR